MRGILKKPASAVYPRRPHEVALGVRGQAGPRAVQRSMSAHANLNGGIRDSLDLAKEQLSDRSVRKSKVHAHARAYVCEKLI